MKIVVLIDNNAPENLACEWGFSAYIEFEGKHILLDAGQSDAFAQNARDLGIDLAAVDFAVLSHAHFDHADGLPAFFEANETAPLYVRESTAEDCHGSKNDNEYIGIAPGTLERYAARIRRVDGALEVAPRVWLLGHTTPDLAAEGARQGMLRMVDGELVPDDFSHEQTLAFETARGIVALNSCSHAGLDNIVSELREAFPDQPICTLIGGLHLFMTPADEVRALCSRLRDAGVERIYTGHCTGDEAIAILREELGDVCQVEQFESGLTIDFD